MKRICSILLVGVALVAVMSCGNRGKNVEVVELEDTEVSAEESSSTEIRLYSNAYDGYTNVRQSPTSKSKALGKLRNGNEYVVLVGEEGNWYEVEYYDQIGYVHKDHVGETPSKPVTVDVDANWLAGIWSRFDVDWCYIVEKNGTFSLYHGEDEAGSGTWRLEGQKIILTITKSDWDVDGEFPKGSYKSYVINKKDRMLGDMTWRKSW